MNTYDLIVIGNGHAGCEAANAAALLGHKVIIISISLDRFGWLSCNPSIGGLAKGHLVRELDVLGGLMGKVIDSTGIQFKRLNRKKGRAVQGTRAQADKEFYSSFLKKELFKNNNIDFFQAEVSELIIENNNVKGVRTLEGINFYAKKVIIASGTFLNAKLHYGNNTVSGGRSGEKASDHLADFLIQQTSHKYFSLKTGTPARIDERSIDFDSISRQPGDNDLVRFSFEKQDNSLPIVDCFLTNTNEKTHKIISDNIDLSPVYSGKISSKGPRYCPSIEDKVNRFPERPSHQVFLEPEGINHGEYYANGISTGLPINIQQEFYSSIKGLEKVKITRPAYAVEYLCVDPQELFLSLESKHLKNLYFAGQINGTSGYEEAAVQGYVAGVNAAKAISGEEQVIFDRDNSYIGVLIDDIVTKGVDEPYRLFTSRSENRLYIREDNADIRLCDFAKKIGTISKKSYESIKDRWKRIKSFIEELDSIKIYPKNEINQILLDCNLNEIKKPITAKDFLRRQDMSFELLAKVIDRSFEEYTDILEQTKVEIVYEYYIRSMKEEQERMQKFMELSLKQDFNYNNIENLTQEVKEKLNKIKPINLAHAQRIPGITPAAINVLLLAKKRGEI
jgi:tRNA uridine 5-carboxymethylaminomethyl modification enzyme